MTTAAQLAKHVDDPEGTRHRLTALDGQRIRCHDCKQTVLAVAPPLSAASTSTLSSPLNIRDNDRCQKHLGQRKGFCGSCRADELVAEHPYEVPPLCEADGCDRWPVDICACSTARMVAQSSDHRPGGAA